MTKKPRRDKHARTWLLEYVTALRYGLSPQVVLTEPRKKLQAIAVNVDGFFAGQRIRKIIEREG